MSSFMHFPICATYCTLSMKVVKIILFTLLLGTIFAFSGSKDIICVFPFSLSLVILIFFLLFNHHAKNDAALTIARNEDFGSLGVCYKKL